MNMKSPGQHGLTIFIFLALWLSLSSAVVLQDNQENNAKCAFVKDCEEKAKNATRSCSDFVNFLQAKCKETLTSCQNYTKKLVNDCVAGFCKDCFQKAEKAYKDCFKFYAAFPAAENMTFCSEMKKDLLRKCPGICKANTKGTTKLNPGKDCKDVLNSGHEVPSGMYWIKPNGDDSPVQAYCDMKFQGGGWTLASYGYIATNVYSSFSKSNKNIPNMNHPNGFNWHPNQRANSNGLIALEHGAVHLAQSAQAMIMAGGGNPSNGGINEYDYVYLIDISRNPYKITFANHGRFRGAVGNNEAIPKMHVVEFEVTALKGDSGTVKRYALGEALGSTWSDSFPTGYGFTPIKTHYGTWDRGPFFPSFHSGDGSTSSCRNQAFPPDIGLSCPHYNHYGWHSLNAMKKTGQMSIWFK